MIVISGIRDFHIDSIREDGGHTLARELAHVYHFYLFGERGRSGNMKLPTPGNPKVPVSIEIVNREETLLYCGSSVTHVQKCTYLGACSILINVPKCPAKSKRKPSRCNFRVSDGV